MNRENKDEATLALRSEIRTVKGFKTWLAFGGLARPVQEAQET